MLSYYLSLALGKFFVFFNKEISYLYNSNTFKIPLPVFNFFISSTISYIQNFHFWKLLPNIDRMNITGELKKYNFFNSSFLQKSEGKFEIPDLFYT